MLAIVVDAADNCKCGRRNDCLVRDSKAASIIDGAPSCPFEFPWLVRVNGCGGSLINDKWVLTAAHCRRFFGPVRLGVLDLFSVNPFEETRRVVRTVLHPQYDPHSADFDFALLELDERVKFNFAMSPVCLPANSDDDEAYLWSRVTAAGWGQLEQTEGPNIHGILFKADNLTLLPVQLCGDYEPQLLTESMICAGGPQDTCQGDSGGPLIGRRNDGAWVLLGITSWGFGCNQPEYPGVYAKVTMVLDWIEETVGDDGICRP